jgi:ATP-dependent DNA ligase
MKSEKLFYMGAKKVLYQWEAWTEGNLLYTRHGQVHGKLQTSIGRRCEGKNTGRANATTPIEQAELELKSLIAHKLKIKYATTPESAVEERFLPMLAHNFKKHHNGISYPVFVQRKYDGFRCLASKEDGEVTLYSRQGDIFNLPHISKELAQHLPDGSVLDGELYLHNTPFQKIASWIKRNRKESENLNYIVYDVPEAENNDQLQMYERALLLELLKLPKWKHIEIAPTTKAANYAEVLDLEIQYVSKGYEGAIVRTWNGVYSYNRRSYSLLKVKSFEDAEYVVHDAHAGIGKFQNLCIFECLVNPKKPATKENLFNCVPMGTEAERKAYLRDKRKYKGKLLTVKFQGVSDVGKPRFPVGKGFCPSSDI